MKVFLKVSGFCSDKIVHKSTVICISSILSAIVFVVYKYYGDCS